MANPSSNVFMCKVVEGVTKSHVEIVHYTTFSFTEICKFSTQDELDIKTGFFQRSFAMRRINLYFISLRRSLR